MKWLCLLLLLPSLAFGFPTNAVIDTFTSAGPAQPLGGIWSDDVFAFGLGCEKDGGTVTKDAGSGGDSGCWITAPFSGPLLEVYIELQNYAVWGAGTTLHNLLFCLSNPGSATNTLGYALGMQTKVGAPDELTVRRLNANKAFVDIGTKILQEFSDGDQAGIEMTAPGVFDVWFKDGAGAWTNLGTRTDPGTAYDCTNTHIGLNPRSTAARFDNLGGGTIGTVPGTGSNPFLHLLLR